MKRHIVSTLLIALSFYGANNALAASWYNAAWQYRQSIDFVGTKVSSTLTNFPALIAVTSTVLAYSNFAGHMGTSTGNDIVFTSSDGTTKLNHEIEAYSSSTGALVAWVNIPSMADAATTTIYMYYGNANATNQQNATSTWNSTYAGVYHLQQTTTSTAAYILDSTQYASNASSSGTGYPTPSSSVVSGGQNFIGSPQALTMATTTGNPLDINTGVTIEAWVLPTTLAAGSMDVVANGNSGSNQDYDLEINRTAGKADILWGGSFIGTGGTTLSTSTWNYIVGRRTGVSGAWTANVYVNGIRDSSSTTATNPNATNLKSYIGNLAAALFYKGKIDEVRISSSSLSEGYILTTYNNQNSPSTFEVFGTEEKGLATVRAKVGRLLIKLRRLIIRQQQ